MLVEILTILVFLLILKWFGYFKSKASLMLDNIPGPTAYPIIGNLLEFDYPNVEVTETFKQLSFKYGPVYILRLGLDPLVFIRDPEDVEVVIGNTSVIDKSSLYLPLYPWLNEGLLTNGGDVWRRHRKIITPAFHFNILEKFVPIFNKNASIFTDKMMNMLGRDVDVTMPVSLCSLDIISESAMGIVVNAQQEESEYVKAINELQEIIAHRNFKIWHRSFLFPFLPSGRRHDKLIKYLHSVTENMLAHGGITYLGAIYFTSICKFGQSDISQVIKERKAIFDEIKTDDCATDGLGIKKKKAFLDLLLDYNKDGTGMTDKEIREEVDTLMFEGYDTTSSTISFCLYNLSQHPDVQDKAFRELDEMFGNSERNATYQDLVEMKYLEKVIKESLRRYPTVQFVGRMSKTDLQLKSGYTIPANTSISVLIEAMNHDPALFPEPLKFDPERFNEKPSHPFSFIPFAGGPRNCIGQKYALLEVKSVISSVLRKFKLLPSNIPVTPLFHIVFKSSTGVNVRFEKREYR